MIQVVVILLKILDVLAWILLLGPLRMIGFKQAKDSTNGERVYVGDEVIDSQAPRFRKKGFSEGLLTKPVWQPDAETLTDLLQAAVNRNQFRDAMGTRQFLEMKDVGEKFPVKCFGETDWITYAEMGDMASKFGRGLRSLGMRRQPLLKPGESPDTIKGSCSLVIFEDTCMEWSIAAQGAWREGMLAATVYGTLGPDAVAQAVTEGESQCVLCNRKNIGGLLEAAKSMPTLKTIIYTDQGVEASKLSEPVPSSTSIRIINFNEVIELGESLEDDSEAPTADMVAVIMYTSGTTGKPKGVVIKHKSVLATIAAVGSTILPIIPQPFTHVAYLPLAHIFELCVQIGTLALGGTIGYADPRTLTATGARPHGALEEFRPHLFMGVPKIYDVIMKGAAAKLAKESPVKQYLVNAAFEWKNAALRSGRSTPIFDLLVFRKFKTILGGRVTFALSGGGPLASDVQEWLRVAFGCQVVQGYGLTETCAGASLEEMNDFRGGIAGSPVCCTEIMLRSCIGDDDEPEVLDRTGKPYLRTDTCDHLGRVCQGRGEVMLRGLNVASGYYRMPEKTKEAFGEDGWFRTGDVGEFLEDGSLVIVDRVKNLVKLKGGEYIAMENMELVYSASEHVDAVNGGMMVFGDGSLDRPVALVQVNSVNLEKLAQSSGIEFESLEELCLNKTVEKAVLDSMHALWAKGRLSPIEKLAGIGLLCSPWTPGNKCLTASNKLARHGIIARDGVLLDKVMVSGMR